MSKEAMAAERFASVVFEAWELVNQCEDPAVWNPLKALRACAPSKATPVARAFSAGAMRRNPCFWLGGSGKWDDSTKWMDGRIPRDGDSVVIPRGHVEAIVADDVRLECVTLHEGATLGIERLFAGI